MAFNKLLIISTISCCVFAWKPIPNPSPASSSPAFSRSVIIQPHAAESRSTTTYHGNFFPSNPNAVHAVVSNSRSSSASSLSSRRDSDVDFGKSTGGYFANKLHNGFLSTVSWVRLTKKNNSTNEWSKRLKIYKKIPKKYECYDFIEKKGKKWVDKSIQWKVVKAK